VRRVTWHGVLGRAGVLALSPLFTLYGLWVACGPLRRSARPTSQLGAPARVSLWAGVSV